ncbi:MAG: hypothetical protein HYZ53_07360 [Planctomycetes bacterium]|nr:hypothetical protein [Planctomycetota bacterium]
MAKTFAEDQLERGKAIGTEIGKELGKELGKMDAKRETLLELLRLRFGSLPAEVEARVAEMTDMGRLNELLKRVLTASSVAEMGI